MGFSRRRVESGKEAALAEARKATAAARRKETKLKRYREKKQAHPVDRMTTNQWTGSGGN